MIFKLWREYIYNKSNTNFTVNSVFLSALTDSLPNTHGNEPVLMVRTRTRIHIHIYQLTLVQSSNYRLPFIRKYMTKEVYLYVFHFP